MTGGGQVDCIYEQGSKVRISNLPANTFQWIIRFLPRSLPQVTWGEIMRFCAILCCRHTITTYAFRRLDIGDCESGHLAYSSVRRAIKIIISVLTTYR